MECEKSKSAKVFATPPIKTFDFSKDMFDEKEWANNVTEWIRSLLNENEKLKADAHPKTGLTISEAAHFLSLTTKKLGSSFITKFLALDIYQKFCLQHIEYLTNYVFGGGVSDEAPEKCLETVQSKVGQQAPLRVLTCLWIASKLMTHKRGVTKEAVKQVLLEIGSNISVNGICKSEIRILEQIQFNCQTSSTLPEYIGVLVAYIGTVLNSEAKNTFLGGLHLDRIYQTSLQVLEFVYFHYDLIYDEIFYKVTGLKVVSSHHIQPFARVRCDRMLLASSVIAAAGWLLDRNQLFDALVQKLCSVNEIPSEDLVMFSECIINKVFSWDQ